MQIQLSTEFALHGLIYLAKHRGHQPIQLTVIATAICVRQSYLRKLFQNLVRAGILDAYKGAGGGYSMKLDPDQVTFYDVLRAIEGAPGAFRCYSTERGCSMHPHCPIIVGFGEAFSDFSKRLKQFTLADFLDSETVHHHDVPWMQATAL
jgi:Rrf2 family protein